MTTRNRKTIAFMTAVLLTASGCSGVGSGISGEEEILLDMPVDDGFEALVDEPLEEIMLETSTTSQYEESVSEADSSAAASAEIILPKEEGKILRILCRNEDVKNAFEGMYGTENLPEGISVEFTVDINLTSDYEYADYLSGMTGSGGTNPVDIFVTEPDYMYSQINSELTLPLSEVGFAEEDTADMFGYTIELGTSKEGVLKAVSWQAEPGVFAYRRDIAEEVFGNSSPDYIAELMAQDYSLAAESLAEKGFYITGSTAETYRVYAQNKTYPWIDKNGGITVDAALKQWAEDMLSDVRNGFNPNYGLWTFEWCETFYGENNVFGIYLPVWGTEGVIENGGSESGIWGICSPIKPYYWGGNFLCVSADTDNPVLCGEVLKALTCNSEAMGKYVLESEDYFCNSRNAMKKIADGYYSEFFSQNTYEVYLEEAEKISAAYRTEADTELDNNYTYVMQNYINDYASYEDCEAEVLESWK
ncbi:MAG: extracellular solute-binding protein [Oscillospiraceae bacterium]|nr:extracellular solute-binding protein [Oscillospiraceae bacterium]